MPPLASWGGHGPLGPPLNPPLDEDEIDRQTDGRMKESFIDPAAHYYAGSVNRIVE